MSIPPNEPDFTSESPGNPAGSDDWGVGYKLDHRDIAQPSTRAAFGPTARAWAVVAILIAVVLGGWLLVGAYTGVAGDGTIYLVGPYVDLLGQDARVVLGQEVIGSVRRVGMREGQMAATLSIDRSTLSDLPADTEFAVASLNKWMPGNLGVRALPPTASNVSERLRDAAVVKVQATTLPPVVPPRFWLVVAGCALIVALLAVCAKLLQTVFTFVRIIHGLAFAAVAIIALLTYMNTRVSL